MTHGVLQDQRRWAHLAAIVAIVLCAVALQAAGHLNCDDAWFMTFAEKVLGGARAYVDVSDPNPPAAFLAYMPALILARALHLPAEPVVVGTTQLAGLVSLAVSGRILTEAGLLAAHRVWVVTAAACFILLLVPAFCFAEREHFALIALLPMLAVSAARRQGASVAPGFAVLAGIGAGVTLAFKPYYAIPLGLVAIASWRRGARLWPKLEWVAAAVTYLLYVGVVFWLFPAYVTDALPLATEVYAGAHESTLTLFKSGASANLVLLAALLIVTRGRFRDPCCRVLFAASAGFCLTYFVQAKGWMNHAYPGVALSLLAGVFLSFETTEPRPSPHRRFALFVLLPLMIAAPFFFGVAIDLTNQEEYPGLTAAVARLAPPHPTIITLAELLDLGHPLVRRLDGVWSGTQNCLWVSYAVRYRLAQGSLDPTRRDLLLRRQDEDERLFMADVTRRRPDVLLTETPALESWARHQPLLSKLFEPYHLAGKVGVISIWLRNATREST